MLVEDTEQPRPSTASCQVPPWKPNNNPTDYGAAMSRGRTHVARKFVLCFDGTGNKFSGTDADSNILKIYRMLDRNGDDQFHYYQPGIGTYITKANGSMTRTGRWERFQSWYAKAKDSAIGTPGTSFDVHVMAAYKFLMRYYSPGDDIYFFGFSRGAYTARFLAEMLDHVGLLSTGNEEMCQFAWKTFQKWQCRLPEARDKERKLGEKSAHRKLLDFMCAFRETFSRPVKPIRFLGLFDTVNSVPAFENAWMQRSKFPYTARSSARVIRHAVAIDERRGKFRQDLISQEKPDRSMYYKRRPKHNGQLKHTIHGEDEKHDADEERNGEVQTRGRRDTLAPPERYRDPHETSGVRSLSVGCSRTDGSRRSTTPSMRSFDVAKAKKLVDEEGEQDIQEVWFPGCHADIGGGWPLGDDGSTLSHVALVWMVREAQKAGLEFDQEKLEALHCCYEGPTAIGPSSQNNVPSIDVNPPSPTPASDPNLPIANQYTDEDNILHHHYDYPETLFFKHLHGAATKGRIHDVLQFNNGANHMRVVSWNIMEYLPFRRMDLQEDGTWRAIRWPLPKGETRDIPAKAIIHCSVIKRMLADPMYRPGNLIVGGGGRGVRHAPQAMGIGKWVVACEEGDYVGECFVRREPPERRRTEPVEPAPFVGVMQGNCSAAA
ncbi:hypothetical protein BDW02DRAFT_517022 [Decorospora gaudefroyi]|uniref:T6SS Phospholipase effector Tle1-like catalytic domain-containing protein n=1 Tax=Decorospora gaudefroyi TaxID=184978 RepID=A0A6A5KUT7_9PLEO|nr:hypothetical protein BDW02DRAFT_517022 [Decorospora gaudefroyi]